MSPRTFLLFVATVLAAPACKSDAPPASSPSPSPSSAPRAKAADIDTAAAKQLIAGGAAVIDVREPDEFADMHLPTARNVPLGEVGARLAEIEQAAGAKDKPIVVYCASGARSSRAKRELEAAGFTNVVNGGGYRALSAP